jgi:hypothetical protein
MSKAPESTVSSDSSVGNDGEWGERLLRPGQRLNVKSPGGAGAADAKGVAHTSEECQLEQMPLGLNRRDSQPLVNERVCPP